MTSLTFAQTSPLARGSRLPPLPRMRGPPSHPYLGNCLSCRCRLRYCHPCPAWRRRPPRPALWPRRRHSPPRPPTIPRRPSTSATTNRRLRLRHRRGRLDSVRHRLAKMVSLPACLCGVPLKIVAVASIVAPRPQSQLPFALTSFVQGPSRPVNDHCSPQLRDQVHPPGASGSTAAAYKNPSRALDGT